MADMHPHRRAQLELEAAEQIALAPPVQKCAISLAAELAAAASSMRAAATGANSEHPAVGRAAASMQTVLWEHPAARLQRDLKPVMEVSKKSIVATKKRKKSLRLQIKENDRAGNFDLAQKSFDELAAITQACSAESAANKNDPQRHGGRARRKAARAEQRDTAMANGTYVTPEERHTRKEIKLEAKRKADPASAAREAAKLEVKKLKRQEKRATTRAVARYASCRKQQLDDVAADQGLPSDERRLSAQYAVDEQQQTLQHAVGQEEHASTSASHHFHEDQPSRQDDNYQPEFSRIHDREQQQDARCEQHQQHLLVRYEGPQNSFSRRMGRIRIDDDNDDTDAPMGGVTLPLTTTVWMEARAPAASYLLGARSAEYPSASKNFSIELGQAYDTRRFADWSPPMLADADAEQHRQILRPMHGDGSKPFLDPNSTAYKMMFKMGWAQGNGLGIDGAGKPDLIPVHLKRDRKGVHETQAAVSRAKEVHCPIAKAVAPPDHILDPVSPANPVHRISNNSTSTKRTVVDLTEDEMTDHDVKKAAVFIDLTQDIFIDLT